MRSRRLTAVSSFASVGATDDDADRIVAAERAALSRGAKRSDNALLTGVCLTAPLFCSLRSSTPPRFLAWRRGASRCRSPASGSTSGCVAKRTARCVDQGRPSQDRCSLAYGANLKFKIYGNVVSCV